MNRLFLAVLLASIPALHLAADQAKPVPNTGVALSPAAPEAPQAPKAPTGPIAPAISHAAPAFGAAEQTALVKQYCVTCHNDRAKAGQLTLASFDAAQAAEHLETSEKMIRKLRAGMMPPAGARRPEAAQIKALAVALESRIARAAVANPTPGPRPLQLLTRA